MLRIVLMTILALCITAPARAQNAVDCAQAPVKMTVPGKYTCQDFGIESGGSNKGQFRRANVFGSSVDGVKLSVQLYRSMCNGCYVHDDIVGPEAKDRIQKFNNFTKAGSNWSEMRKIDGSTYSLNFESENRHCTGFVHGEGLIKGGYEYYVVGYFCSAEGKPASDDGDLKSLISRISVSAH
jgi:hypothetical protein